ncbi:MAG: class I SAM-dependent methyltransferase [Tepidisphaeraceae bacterium]
MLEILDPKKIDPIAYDGGLLDDIRAFSKLPDQRIGWHYVMDYCWLAVNFGRHFKRGMRVVDIGCGPGAVHGYLEYRYGTDVVGIDMEKWGDDYVDLQGDFCDDAFRAANGFGDGSIDLIVSASAFEHNEIEAHRRLVDVCLKTLRPGGVLLTTFATGRGPTHFFKKTHQWNMDRDDIESIYRDRFDSFDYESVWQRWRAHHDMAPACLKRFGKMDDQDPPYLAVGAEVVKRAA